MAVVLARRALTVPERNVYGVGWTLCTAVPASFRNAVSSGQACFLEAIDDVLQVRRGGVPLLEFDASGETRL